MRLQDLFLTKAKKQKRIVFVKNVLNINNAITTNFS